jgi:outer membrane cobalamin receptor
MKSTVWLICACIVGGHGAAIADVTLAGEDSLDSVTVTAKRLEETLPEQLSEYGIRLDSITAEQVKNGGYVDIAEALQALTPGLSISTKNGPFDYVDISLQGSRTGDVLWLVDGVRVNNRLYHGTTPLDTLPAAIVERIEVLDGGEALYYGTQAVAGAVNIVTKSFSDVPQARFSVGADTLNGRHLDGFASDSVGANHFVVYGSNDRSSGYHAFRTEDYQPSDTDRDRGYDVTTVGGKYAFDFNDKVRWNISYQHTEGDLDFAQPYRVARDVNSRKEDLATLKLDFDVTDTVALYTKAYYHLWSTHYDTYYNDLANPGTIDVLYQNAFWGYRDYGVNALAKLSLTQGLDYFVGYDMQRYNGHDEVLVIQGLTETTNAVFAQVRTTKDLFDHARFAAGVRYNKPTTGEQSTIWNASGQYDFSPALFVRGNLGTNFRLPDAEELYANDPDDERGNPNLKPERTRSVNLSVGGKFTDNGRAVDWELIGFARNISNLIDYATFDDATNQDVFGNVAGTVRTRGGEAVINASLSDAWSGNLSYTYTRTREDGSDQQLTRIPLSLFKANVDFHPGNLPVGAGINVRHTGPVATTVGSDLVGYGGYTVVDLMGRYFLDDARHHTLTVDIDNLLNKKYGRPARGCLDVSSDGPNDCSAPYQFVNRGLPLMLRASYTYKY